MSATAAAAASARDKEEKAQTRAFVHAYLDFDFFIQYFMLLIYGRGTIHGDFIQRDMKDPSDVFDNALRDSKIKHTNPMEMSMGVGVQPAPNLGANSGFFRYLHGLSKSFKVGTRSVDTSGIPVREEDKTAASDEDAYLRAMTEYISSRWNSVDAEGVTISEVEKSLRAMQIDTPGEFAEVLHRFLWFHPLEARALSLHLFGKRSDHQFHKPPAAYLLDAAPVRYKFAALTQDRVSTWSDIKGPTQTAGKEIRSGIYPLARSIDIADAKKINKQYSKPKSTTPAGTGPKVQPTINHSIFAAFAAQTAVAPRGTAASAAAGASKQQPAPSSGALGTPKPAQPSLAQQAANLGGSAIVGGYNLTKRVAKGTLGYASSILFGSESAAAAATQPAKSLNPDAPSPAPTAPVQKTPAVADEDTSSLSENVDEEELLSAAASSSQAGAARPLASESKAALPTPLPSAASAAVAAAADAEDTPPPPAGGPDDDDTPSAPASSGSPLTEEKTLAGLSMLWDSAQMYRYNGPFKQTTEMKNWGWWEDQSANPNQSPKPVDFKTHKSLFPDDGMLSRLGDGGADADVYKANTMQIQRYRVGGVVDEKKGHKGHALETLQNIRIGVNELNLLTVKQGHLPAAAQTTLGGLTQAIERISELHLPEYVQLKSTIAASDEFARRAIRQFAYVIFYLVRSTYLLLSYYGFNAVEYAKKSKEYNDELLASIEMVMLVKPVTGAGSGSASAAAPAASAGSGSAASAAASVKAAVPAKSAAAAPPAVATPSAATKRAQKTAAAAAATKAAKQAATPRPQRGAAATATAKNAALRAEGKL